MGLKRWIIHTLGGYTEEDKVKLNESYSRYVSANIDKIKGATCLTNNEFRINKEIYDDTVYILGDGVVIRSCYLENTKINVAPWTSGTIVESCVVVPRGVEPPIPEKVIQARRNYSLTPNGMLAAE